MIDKSFMARGACRGLDPELFHPVRGDVDTLKAAQAVCDGCPVREECLEYAIVNGEEHGIWGGASEAERKRIAQRRRAAGELQKACALPGCGELFTPRRAAAYCSDACARAARSETHRRSHLRRSA